MERVLDQAKQFANETDSAGRRELALALRDLSYSLETPKDTIVRINSYVSPLTLPCVTIWRTYAVTSLSELQQYAPASTSICLVILWPA